jgi:putative oxidoreductase
MNIVLWILQIFMGLYFLAIGVMHFIIPPGLPAQMAWMYELSPWLHYVSGIAEILGGIGLILPSLLRIRPQLTVWAAYGLIAVMVGAMVWHITRGEVTNLAINLINIALLAVIAYGRSRRAPIPEKV